MLKARVFIVLGLSMTGCIEHISAVRLSAEKPVSVPESLVPGKAGEAFSSVVQNCQSISRSLAEFGGRVRNQQEKAADWAKVFSIAGIAVGGGTAVVGQRLTNDSIPAANTALIGGLAGVVAAAPATYYSFKTGTQNSEMEAARNASANIQTAISARNLELMKAAALVDNDKTKQNTQREEFAYNVAVGLQNDCNQFLMGTNIALKDTKTVTEPARQMIAKISPERSPLLSSSPVDDAAQELANKLDEFVQLVSGREEQQATPPSNAPSPR